MRILVCGGRDYENDYYVDQILEVYYKKYGDALKIIHGGADGADECAHQWARMYGVPHTCYPANWNKYKKAAGAIRNKQMIDEGQPDLVIAFPGGVGTANMIMQARKNNIEVIEIHDESVS